MQIKQLAPIALVGLALVAQSTHPLNDVRIKSVEIGDPEPPLHSVKCQGPTYGYLHLGERTKLTPAEIGDYVLSAAADGKLVTLYPESKSGIFAREACRHDSGN
jgi:hypothetical protein